MVLEVFHSSGLNLIFQIEMNMFQSMVILQSSFPLYMVCHKGQCRTNSVFNFINDLPKVYKFLNFYPFADDTDIYYESSDLLNVRKIVNRELRKVRKWLDANRLASNINKTNFVLLHSSQHNLTEHIVLKIGNKRLKQKSHNPPQNILQQTTKVGNVDLKTKKN